MADAPMQFALWALAVFGVCGAVRGAYPCSPATSALPACTRACSSSSVAAQYAGVGLQCDARVRAVHDDG